jgi:glutamate synthase (NADPH) large chain
MAQEHTMTMPAAFGFPSPQGLYHPSQEHDSCGLGFVVNVRGAKSHDIVQQSLQVLVNLAHRGACGCDPETGDGAGILLQIPHEYFLRECDPLGFSLPDPGRYGVGMVFLPVSKQARLQSEGLLETIVNEEGLKVLGWRDTPVEQSAIGRIARGSQPYIEQIFIACPDDMTEDTFERKLYVVRKRAESAVAKSQLQAEDYFYISSLSCRTIVYKGLMIAHQLAKFYPELSDSAVVSALAIVHQRFSTNTFPSWQLAHPYRYVAHNGEINTINGNVNWMNARQSMFASPLFGDDMQKLFPVITPHGSDSASFDNAIELLVQSGRSLAHAIAMLIPEAWDRNPHLAPERRAFYEYHASLMEPWDGPAAIAFTDGRCVGATLDRNGLRPGRYIVTNDDLVIFASESGVLDVPVENVRQKGRLRPGQMFLVDTVQGRIVPDEELKDSFATRQPYAKWLADNLITLDKLPEPVRVQPHDVETLVTRQRAFGFTDEDLRLIFDPMAENAEEPIGSMGTDTPLACLSDRPQSLFSYFKQLFAQVTNPPIDPIREAVVMSLTSYIGGEGNILDEIPGNCQLLKLEHPILTNRDLEKLRRVSRGDLLAATISTVYLAEERGAGLRRSIEELCRRASLAVRAGYTLLILSDRGEDSQYAPIPSLLALAAVHNHLIKEQTRNQVALIVESGEPREVMHFALLLGYGASAVNPYLALETVEQRTREAYLSAKLTTEKAIHNYIAALNKGLLKTFSKMGISTLQSYQGAQVFEAIGLSQDVIEPYFRGTPSRISGVDFETLATETLARHHFAHRENAAQADGLWLGGNYQFRVNGERHLLNSQTISKLQHAVRQADPATFQEYTDLIDAENRELCTLRGLMKLKRSDRPVPLEEVEPAKEIVKRFATGAMSYGSISKEAHETLAIAMNQIGGRSNTGEGGEDASRFRVDADGISRRSAVKQVASARFGVTTHYLVNADELQIKMAQGAKPGEGGQLPGKKVDEIIAKLRHSTPGVSLISPPPHHDIYSIEDLAQLIYDLKNVNPSARISVKLVSEVGVGTVAAGVAKAHADVILISGDSGGTGAAPLSSIKHAGTPWELGLAETQQVLLLNDLRSRVRIQTDGKLQTGRDVIVAALLGAEEFGFATTPLIAMGCVMMRKCHLNTCSVGIATQDPVLRERFRGQPEHVVNFFFFLAEQVRQHMAAMGFRSFDELVGRVDMLDVRDLQGHSKAQGLDLSAILHFPPLPGRVARRCTTPQDHGLQAALDVHLLEQTKVALEGRSPVELTMPIRNLHRSVGAMLSGEIARRYGPEGFPDDSIRLTFEGSAGQSFGAFLAKGVTLSLFGDANDYVGKGLSGGRIIVRPPRSSRLVPEENIIVGNVVLYGATSGEAFFSGIAGERFAVRNSGATAVVEGVGDHGCEYMTNGTVVVLGSCGRNFAAGMSGGRAFVLDTKGEFASQRCNHQSIDLDPVTEESDQRLLQTLIQRHAEYTGSSRARFVLENWEEMLSHFVIVFPRELKRVLGLAQAGAAYPASSSLPPSAPTVEVHRG